MLEHHRRVPNDALLARAQLDWKIREGSVAEGLFSAEARHDRGAGQHARDFA